MPTLPATGQIGWAADVAGAGLPGPPATAGRRRSGDAGFGAVLGKALDGLQATQTKADSLAVQAATGDLTNVHDYMIAATEASLATELTVAVRNKAVEAFNQIMNMAV